MVFMFLFGFRLQKGGVGSKIIQKEGMVWVGSKCWLFGWELFCFFWSEDGFFVLLDRVLVVLIVFHGYVHDFMCFFAVVSFVF